MGIMKKLWKKSQIYRAVSIAGGHACRRSDSRIMMLMHNP